MFHHVNLVEKNLHAMDKVLAPGSVYFNCKT